MKRSGLGASVLAALWAGYAIGKHRRERSRPKLGNADAYEGNLITPPESRRPEGSAGAG